MNKVDDLINLIKTCLKPLKIPVSFQCSDTEEDTFITFSEYYEHETHFADNQSNTKKVFIQVNIWSIEQNTSEIQNNIISLLKSVGFKERAIGPTLNYKEYGLYQKPLRFLFYLDKNIKEEN